MPVRILLVVLSLISANSIWAITCYFTLAKDNCWNNYTVTVDVMDAATAKVLTTAVIPPGKSWVRQIFPCTPKEKLIYRAQFSPVIWEREKGQIYYAKNYWSLPNDINSGDSAWNVSVCYPSDFSQIPLPPEATGTCKCDFDSIPIIPPKKI
ncbi:periplasmic protein [Legionella sainthelensi]|uniref:Periplasmic protein n=1 Tax=Legionella sainthelensi TaxID=28087 RepID=A0A0W0YVU9_9GAMM|nr:hypothetical protein [Legionella sainthelensi]KTD60646.1 periplasmic protein [Legionella sainthelensi]VEH30796.1 periplasmic protein [Legionella sainthelensi]